MLQKPSKGGGQEASLANAWTSQKTYFDVTEQSLYSKLLPKDQVLYSVPSPFVVVRDHAHLQ